MRKKSLQQIEDFYVGLGYRGIELRRRLSQDVGYKELLTERKQKLSEQFKISTEERKRYVMSTDLDFEILSKCKKLEKKNLTGEDRRLMKIIKAQLEDDWRKSLLGTLNRLLKKYK
jgi:hypothetical protein